MPLIVPSHKQKSKLGGFKRVRRASASKPGARPPLPKNLPAGLWSRQAKQVLSERYLAKDKNGKVVETPDQMCWRVAWEVALAETNFGKSQKDILKTAKSYYRILVSKKFLPNSPTLMNAGKANGLQYSACYVLPVEDSIPGIFDAIKWQALVHKSGGGTGFSFSRLRPKGARVSTSQGIASGPVSFLRIYNEATQQIKQGGTRRGANMGILRVDHPDIQEFIHCKKDGSITNFNISVGITQKFMDAYFAGQKYDLISPRTGQAVGRLSAKKVFAEIAQGAWQTGDPGLVFLDAINQSPANPVPGLGPIEATNPCFAKGTMIATEKGWLPIEEIAEKYPKGGIKVLVDKHLLPKTYKHTKGLLPISQAFFTGKKRTLKIKTKLGYELVVTPDHKIMTSRGWVQAEKLKPGKDEVFIQDQEAKFTPKITIDFKFPRKIRGKNGKVYTNNYPREWNQELGFALGWLIGDGWLRNRGADCRVGFSFGKEDLKVLRMLKPVLNSWYQREVEEIERERQVYHLSYHSKYFVQYFQQLGVKAVKAEKKEVPVCLYSAPRPAVVGFLRGLFTADGTVRDNPKSNSSWVALTAKNKHLLKGVQLLLLSMGIKSQIMDRSRPARVGIFKYRAVNGEKRKYNTDGVLYELGIFGENREIFRQKIGFLGVKQDRLNKIRFKNFYKRKKTDTIINVKPAGIRQVYDLTEPVTHSVIANGIIGHQCGEQPLYPFDACNLGSIFLTYFVNFEINSNDPQDKINWPDLEKTTRLAVRFLDSVIEQNPFPLPQIDETVKKIRRIGLGVGGWADMLIQLGIPYDSDQALELAEKVMAFIQKTAHLASQDLARERGPFPLFFQSIYKDGPPMRNSTVTTIAPTGSIGIIANASTGIEPLFALAFDHVVGARKLTFINPFFEKAVQKDSLSPDILERVKKHGVVRKIEEAPAKLKAVFGTAHEIDYSWHIKHQAAFQKHTDNAVSKTINLINSTAVKDVEAAYILAYQSGCRGITVYRDGCKEFQVLNIGTGKERSAGQEAALNRPVRNGEVLTPVNEMPALRSRPKTLAGHTYHLKTPLGTAFITINSDQNNNPFEVFINIGKAGTDIKADAEAIGRLISLSLRIPSPYRSRAVLEGVVDQLSGIGGAAHIGFGNGRVKSLADAIAKVLKEHLQLTRDQVPGHPPAKEAGSEESLYQESLPLTQKSPETGGGGFDSKSLAADLCPDCGFAQLVFQEGCAKCLSCGYSKC